MSSFKRSAEQRCGVRQLDGEQRYEERLKLPYCDASIPTETLSPSTRDRQNTLIVIHPGSASLVWTASSLQSKLGGLL